jgi:hypothetical protein
MKAINEKELIAYFEEKKPRRSRKAIACKAKKSPSVKQKRKGLIWAIRS